MAQLKLLAIGITTALALTACGGSSDSSSDTSTSSNTNQFTQTATWTVDATQKVATCYDFDKQAVADCSGTTWDVKFDNSGRSASIWSNSGISGSGKGGVFGLLDWSSLSTYLNATKDPVTGTDISAHYKEDSTSSIFGSKTWYEYNLQGQHKLYPNNRVYLITTDSTTSSTESSPQTPIYALQIINYYNEADKGGYPTIRYIDTAIPNDVKTKQIDASSSTAWTYFNLTTGETVSESDTWHIAFKRMDVKLNGGASGSGKVAGYLAKTPTGYYEADGTTPIVAKFLTDGKETTLTDLTDTASYSKPVNPRTNVTTWTVDTNGSSLNPAYTGSYPTLDYSWYTYDGNTHRLSVKDEANMKGALVRSGEGNSYAKMRLTEIKYPDETSTSILSYTFTFDIQPAK